MDEFAKNVVICTLFLIWIFLFFIAAFAPIADVRFLWFTIPYVVLNMAVIKTIIDRSIDL